MNELQIEPEISNAELKAQCRLFLSGHLPRTPRDLLQSLADSPLAEQPADNYGKGSLLQTLEQEVAQLLGHEAALFIHKGIVAQQIALRVWAGRTGVNRVALHPRSHLDLDERNAYERLHNLEGVRVGQDYMPFTLAELQSLNEPLGVVTVELPLRRAGFKLPAWQELEAIAAWTRDRNLPLHFDGARLWESAPYYERSYAEIAALASSVYVSFYKGLGGMTGSILAGPRDFIDEARVWKTRLGGDLYTAFPYVISALEGLHHHLPRMADYLHLARQIASDLTHQLPEVVVAPNPPQTNSFQLFMPVPADDLRRAVRKIAQAEKVWLFGWLVEAEVPGWTMGEIIAGEATEQWPPGQIVEAVQKLLETARTLRLEQ